jgi:hypothetical protein
MAHNLGLVIAKALQGQLVAGVDPLDIVRQAAIFGARNRDGWSTGMTILTALGNLLAILPKEETYLALFHGVSRIAADCGGAAPRRQRSALASRPDPPTLERWLRRWAAVRHREAAERTALTAISTGARPAALADLLITAETDRVFADSGHSLDFINKAFECLDLIGWQHAADLLPTVIGQMVAARGADESAEWRQPADLIALCEKAATDLPALFAVGRGRDPWLQLTHQPSARCSKPPISQPAYHGATGFMKMPDCREFPDVGATGALVLIYSSRPVSGHCRNRYRSCEARLRHWNHLAGLSPEDSRSK